MTNRQSKKHSKCKTELQSEDLSTYSIPKIVAEPKTKLGKKRKENQVKRESLETNLERKYFDPLKGNPRAGIEKLTFSARDLAVIVEPELYRDIEKKPDRMNNRAVNYIRHQIQLLNTLTANMSELHKDKIWKSPEFRTLLENYLGTAEYSNKKLTKEEEKTRLNDANQWLIDSLTIIEDNLPNAFKDSLKDVSRPYFKLIDAIAKNQGIIEIKIPDRMLR